MREKHVFKSAEIAHVWVHSSDTVKWGNNGANGAVSFNSDGFYSYTTAIGKKMERKGKWAFLLNVTNYSVSTSKHQSALLRAIPSATTVFRLGGIPSGSRFSDKPGARIFDYAIQQAEKCAEKIKKARVNKESLILQQSRWLEQARQTNEFFGLRRKVDDKCVARQQARIATEERRQQREQEKWQAELIMENKQRLVLWLAGKEHFPISIDKIYLRVISEKLSSQHHHNKFMETSHGVRVPLSAAKRAFEFVMKHKEKLWECNGDTFAVGDYQIDKVTKQGVTAGCHRIEWDEIERFAKLQGWA